MFKQLVLAVLIGLSSLMYMIQHDRWFEQYMLNYFTQQFERSLDCRMSARLQEVNFSGKMRLADMHVMPVHGSDWSWHANQFSITFSWWDLLLYGSLDFSILMDAVQMQSYIIDNHVAIKDHFNLAFNGPQVGMYTFLKELICNNTHCSIIDQNKNSAFMIAFDGKAKKINNIFRCIIDVFKGSLDVQDRVLFANMSGSLQFDSFGGRPTLDICLKGAASLEIPQLGAEIMPCYISGAWNHNGGILSIKNVDHSFAIDPIMIQRKPEGVVVSLDAKVPLTYAWRIWNNNNDDARLSGNCLLQAKMTSSDNDRAIDGHLMLQRIHWQDVELGSLGKISFALKGQTVDGSLYLQRTSGACIGGDWSCSLQNGNIQADIKNNARLTFSPKHDWQILPDDLTLHVRSDGASAHVMYEATATHAKVHHQISSQGHIEFQENVLLLKGIFDDNQYDCKWSYQPEWSLDHFFYKRDNGTSLIEIASSVDDQKKYYKGKMAFGCVKDIFKKWYDFDLQGEGIFEIAIDPGQISSVSMHLKDGAIRLPRTYNFINGLDCQLKLDYGAKSCTISDMVCHMHNGRISSKKMLCAFNEDYSPYFVYAPLLIDHCLINMGKEFFAVVSGDLLLSKRSGRGPLLNGQVIIERSQLKENLFSDVFQRNFRNYTAHSFKTDDDELRCDIAIRTKYPVRIQTPFLDTDARIDLHIRNGVRDPEVVGTISLNAGKLYFPYKPLYITTGMLHFLPGRLDDPLIELFAKNTIKKNNITLQVTGSLQNQHVQLESSPTLTEEQIISLLLVGSQEESLNIVMPALIMQNIKSILFGYDQSAANMSRYFNALFKPFGRIHLVPSFIDQSGRGGLRGAVEIDLSDRWRMVFQKNFSLTEDTRFEFEYLFSDDMSARLTRDIRRDVIGEVEMRYKFGNN